MRWSHIDTFIRLGLSCHTSCLYVFALIRRAAQAPDQFVQGRLTAFFIVKSHIRDKLLKLNHVVMSELRRSFNHDLLARIFGALSPFRLNPSVCLIFNKVFNYGHERIHNKSVTPVAIFNVRKTLVGGLRFV